MDNQEIKMPSHNSSKVIVFGFSVIFIVFVVIGGWMAYAPLASSSVAIGQVSADFDKKTIQHLEGGKVTAIYVKDGDKVKKGQVLLKLRDVQIKAQINILSAQYQDALARFARLKAQRDAKSTIAFPVELTDTNAIQDQKNIFITTKRTLEDEKTITKSRVIQLQNQISGLKSLIKSKKIRLASLNEEMLEWKDLYEQRLVDKQRIRELEREANMVDGDLASTLSEISKLNEQIAEVQNQELLREKEFQNDTLKKYVEVKSVVSDLKSKIVANEDIIKRTTIVSPIDGTVVGFEMHTVGGVINPSKPILEIVPDNAKLIVLARVQTTDIDKVKVGLVADIMFSAFNLRKAHVIEGRVVNVSADSFIDEASGMPYYKAKIEVTAEGKSYLKKYGFVLVSGMPAQIMIELGDRTALSYLIKPFREMLIKSFNEE